MPLVPLSKGERSVPVLYLDIDGTVRWSLDELGRFVNGPEDVTVYPEVPAKLAAYRALGWRIVGISNQGGVALGHMTADVCAAAMIETQKQTGDAFDLITFCSHHPAAADPEMAVCWCRKPRIGMVVESALRLAERSRKGTLSDYRGLECYPPHLGLLVGDRDEDRLCAEGAGIRFMDAAVWRASPLPLPSRSLMM